MKKKITLVGAADSLGVPYTRDNIAHEGFYEMLEKDLRRCFELTSINCFHMSTNNDNKYIRKLVLEDLTLADVKQSQDKMLRKCKYSGIYPFLELPKSFLGYYKAEDVDKEIVVRDCIRNGKAIFIYSAFVNDLLKARGLSLFKLLNSQKLKRELTKVDIKPVINELKGNLEILFSLNSEMELYIVGLFVPTRIKRIRKGLADFVKMVNREFEKVAVEYEGKVFVVNNENLSEECFNDIDFHPNRKGHEKMYENLSRVVSSNFCNKADN